MKFCDKNFLLSGDTARSLFHETAAHQPIIDFHCHLSARDLAVNRQFENLHEAWLEGDHYKWRAMRANGISEDLITGDASPREKFDAWAGTVPHTLRNPLFHWTHLELQRYFGFTKLLDDRSAAGLWKEANRILSQPENSARGLVEKMRVKVICTTDDPADDLNEHRAISKSGWEVKVFPTFRPDAALAVENPRRFKEWVRRLGNVAGKGADTFARFLEVLAGRHAAFHNAGGRASDHGLARIVGEPCTQRVAARIFAAAVSGKPVSPAEAAQFSSFMMDHFAGLNARRNWAMQLHLGALRNPNTRLRNRLGADAGADTIGDPPEVSQLAAFLDRLDRDDRLPRTILYNLNPGSTAAFAALTGSFQDSRVPGKVQYGPAWWFLDQERGIREQLDALSDMGLLSRFVGMVTDSRSFLSYPRHEYFRRILCDAIGTDVDSGRIPAREEWLRELLTGICYANARDYFGFSMAPAARKQLLVALEAGQAAS